MARHLVAAGLLIDTEPKTAYEHTLAARARASRLAVVREAVRRGGLRRGGVRRGAGRAARRQADERRPGLRRDHGRLRARPRPPRPGAGAGAQRARRTKLAPALLAELTIVEAGARRDRGELDAALRTLETSHLHSKSREPWVARLRYAYADTLLAAGRDEDALDLVPPHRGRRRRSASPTRPSGPPSSRSPSTQASDGARVERGSR